MHRRRAFSLIELLLAGSLFAIVALLSFLLLRRGTGLWKELIETESAGLELAKAANSLQSDLVRTSINQCSLTNVPPSLAGGGPDGSALCFLSAHDPATGELVLKPDGTPFWQRNVLYYLVVPNSHSGLFGFDCSGGIGPGGFDDHCPHKLLIRKVIDSGPTTTPTGNPVTDEETLLSDVSAYLTRPAGYDMALLQSEMGVERAEVVASRLLIFQVSLHPREVEVDLRAVAIKDAQSQVAVGSVALSSGRFTSLRALSVFPMN